MSGTGTVLKPGILWVQVVCKSSHKICVCALSGLHLAGVDVNGVSKISIFSTPNPSNSVVVVSSERPLHWLLLRSVMVSIAQAFIKKLWSFLLASAGRSKIRRGETMPFCALAICGVSNFFCVCCCHPRCQRAQNKERSLHWRCPRSTCMWSN